MKAYRINTTEIFAARTMGDALKSFDEMHGIEDVSSCDEITGNDLDEHICNTDENNQITGSSSIREVLLSCSETSYIAAEE